MSNENIANINVIFERLKTLKNYTKDAEIADLLGIVVSTLRSRKSRNAIPYEELIANLSAEEFAFVMNGVELRRSEGDSNPLEENMVNEPSSTYPIENIVPDDEVSLSNFAAQVIARLEASPLSAKAKIQIVDSLIRIIQQDLERSQAQNDS
ncbi:MAG: hypothetical protein RLN90_09710 [Balneolaceae bacterium]